MADRLHADALDAAARMLGPMARAGSAMLGAAAGAAARRGRKRRAGVVEAALPGLLATRRHHPGPVVGAVRSRPHPGPLPQAGEGEVRRRAAAFPLPLAGEGGAQRRTRDGAASPPVARQRPAQAPTLPLPRVPAPEHAALQAAALPAAPTMPAAERVAPQAAPLLVPPRTSAPAVAPIASPAAQPPYMPPPAPAAPTLLDEARLGRWLAEHLAEETRRPARGGTGFDPRLSPGWPGTLQGPWGWGG